MTTGPMSKNFGFLAVHDPQFAKLGADAERFFSQDPDISLMRLRQLGEFVAQHTAASIGIYLAVQENQLDLLRRLQDRGVLTPDVAQLFHSLRKSGNRSTHQATGGHREALLALRVARELGVWFHRTFGRDPSFKPGPFVPPPDPKTLKQVDEPRSTELDALRSELEVLRQERDAHRTAAEAAAARAEAEAQERMTAEERARREAEDHAAAMELAEEIDAQRGMLVAENARLAGQLTHLQTHGRARPVADVDALIKKAKAAGKKVELDEAATRRLIDAQLREAQWEADSVVLKYGNGARPKKGRSMAIAEWPTNNGPADYVLFAGLTAVGVVEAKRDAKDIPASVDQAKRYSEGYAIKGDEVLAGGPWVKHRVPFLFATNGRPYLRQLQTKSGIWFRDARRPQNKSRALEAWYTPDGLLDLLKQDLDVATDALKSESTQYLSFLRDYQLAAIKAVEKAIEDGRRECLLAMATGTGKTKTLIALVYRLVKTKRFKRVLFLVDRSALGDQAASDFKDTRLENLLPFTDHFNLQELGSIEPDTTTKVQIATIQAMVHRLYDGSPTVDQYDCIVVDECHRGYLLDREMSDAELSFRDEAEYISAYRRVLDHFDAVKIGLTATPALHTSEIFGPPVFNYSYREAVIDGFLVDHEPPIRIITKLAEDGIHWKAGTEVMVLDAKTNDIRKETLPDDVDVEVEQFNKRVITEKFNRAVSRELANHLDPTSDAKTIVFCVDDAHADIVVKELKDAFPDVEDEAIRKITGSVDKPRQAIRRFKNERLPNIAVTVDLLTTGIDVPPVSNLVFLRRIRSRILYEQMIGRATRLCPNINKERFRIFDAVELYSALSTKTDMHPVVVNPAVTFAQLVAEANVVVDEEATRTIVEQFIAKLQRKKRVLEDEALATFETLTGMGPSALSKKLKAEHIGVAVSWLQEQIQLAALLDEAVATAEGKLISEHSDDIRGVSRGYGEHERPEDYLDAFAAFLKENMNRIPALVVAATKPRELTRKQLRGLRLALDAAGFTEASLDTAWGEAKNEEIIASIIGHIRQAAVGDPLLPYAERIDQALKKILASRSWTAQQRNWLDIIGRQLKAEVVVDREALDGGIFKTKGGGFERLNKLFGGQLEEVIADIQDHMWKESA